MLATRARVSIGKVAARATKQHGKSSHLSPFRLRSVLLNGASIGSYTRPMSTMTNDRSLVLADLARYVSEYRQHGHLLAQIDPLELYQPRWVFGLYFISSEWIKKKKKKKLIKKNFTIFILDAVKVSLRSWKNRTRTTSRFFIGFWTRILNKIFG